MATGKKKQEAKDLDSTLSIRDDAEKKPARSPKSAPDFGGLVEISLVHELQAHQVELDAQAEELIKSKLVLEESREKYINLYEFAPVGYLALSSKALVEEVNLSGATLMKVERSKLVNARFRKFIAKKDLEIWDNYFVNVLDRGEKKTCTLMLIRGDGSVFPARLEGSRIHGRDGELTVRIAISDIADIWQAEEALRESESFNRGLVENLTEYIVIYGPDGTILYVNPASARVLGYDAGTLTGTPLQLYIAEEHRDEVASRIADRWKGNNVSPYEINLLTSDGHQRTVIVKGTPVQHGNNPAILLILIDITERKIAENTLRRVNQKLNVISRLTQEDLFSQIFVLNDYLQLAKTQAAGQDQVILTLQKSQQTARLIQRTIEYSNDYQDLGTKPQKWQNVRMVMLFGLSHMSISEIKHSLETEDLEVFADPLLELVCQRLFENSVKHGGHVTRIRVWHTISQDGATILFEDDGMGIPQEKKEQIFLRSGDTDRASVRSLNFVREILDITGITIKETGEPGKGARFEIEVPKGTWRMNPGINDI